MCQKPVLLDLCSGTKSVGSCIDQDEWTCITVDINSDLGVPDIQCDLRTWERSGEHKVALKAVWTAYGSGQSCVAVLNINS